MDNNPTEVVVAVLFLFFVKQPRSTVLRPLAITQQYQIVCTVVKDASASIVRKAVRILPRYASVNVFDCTCGAPK